MKVDPVASVTGDIKIYYVDQKVMTLLSLMEKCPMDFYEVVFTALNLIKYPLCN